ncbi:MAG: Gfo/Idh/MocA family oxidoreductase [Dermatophilaceae bacterium]|nr:Gfo/Idh/MocA family oxidoreductase [Intrasporangiaceae bacterium]
MRIGLAGTGRIGAFHAATILGLPDPPELVLTDAVPEVAAGVAAELGAEHAPTLDDLFASGIDGFVITTGTQMHAPLLRRGIAEGVPTFCEKPVASNLAETADLARLDAASEVPVQIGFQRRFDTGYRRARAAVRAGELGELHQLRCTTHDQLPPTEAYVVTSGGIFRDCSVHDFDAIRFVTGREVESVYATGGTKGAPFFEASGDLSTGAAVLTLDDGTVALVSAMRYNGGGHDVRMEVHGSHGALAVGFDDSYAFRSAEAGVDFPAGPAHTAFKDRFRGAFMAELAGFVRLVRGEVDTPCTITDGLEAFRIAEACELSRSERRPVAMSEIPGLADPAG